MKKYINIALCLMLALGAHSPSSNCAQPQSAPQSHRSSFSTALGTIAAFSTACGIGALWTYFGYKSYKKFFGPRAHHVNNNQTSNTTQNRRTLPSAPLAPGLNATLQSQQTSYNTIQAETLYPTTQAPKLSQQSQNLLEINQRIDRIFNKYDIFNTTNIKEQYKHKLIPFIQKNPDDMHNALQELYTFLQKKQSAFMEAELWFSRMQKESPEAYDKWEPEFATREPEIYGALHHKYYGDLPDLEDV